MNRTSVRFTYFPNGDTHQIKKIQEKSKRENPRCQSRIFKLGEEPDCHLGSPSSIEAPPPHRQGRVALSSRISSKDGWLKVEGGDGEAIHGGKPPWMPLKVSLSLLM